MLTRRDLSSSKHYKDIPCVVAKSLIAKYQRNPKCKKITSLVIPICGDKGKQIKLEEGIVRIPALFKKEKLQVFFPKPIVGFIRSVEFYKRNGDWYANFCYNTQIQANIEITGTVGVDRNSVGNIATLADPQTGKVLKLGISPAPTKEVMRGRRKNLQKAGKKRLLRKIRRKQSRRMTYENHRVSKTIVNYAAKHCCAVIIEDLKGVLAPKSKIKRYSQKNQWAFAQLETFLTYKCALRGIPIIKVDPAYTSQTCSRCGEIHKPNGKKYVCLSCGHNDHRDANAAFVIAMRGQKHIDDCNVVSRTTTLGSIGSALAEKVQI